MQFHHGCPNRQNGYWVSNMDESREQKTVKRPNIGCNLLGRGLDPFEGPGFPSTFQRSRNIQPSSTPHSSPKNIRILQKNHCSFVRSTVNLNLCDVRTAKSAAKLPGQQSRYSSRAAVENQNGHRQWYEDSPYHPMAPLLPKTQRQHLVCKHLPKLLQLFWPDLSLSF